MQKAYLIRISPLWDRDDESINGALFPTRNKAKAALKEHGWKWWYGGQWDKNDPSDRRLAFLLEVDANE